MYKLPGYYYIAIIVSVFIILVCIIFQRPKHIIIKPNVSVSTNTSVSSTLSLIASYKPSTVSDNKNQSLSKFLYKVKTAPSPKGLAFVPNGQEI